jgi:hypothetical protein
VQDFIEEKKVLEKRLETQKNKQENLINAWRQKDRSLNDLKLNLEL